LEWKLTYVGSAESEKYDQVLDTVFVGPVAPGQYRFVFQVGIQSCVAALVFPGAALEAVGKQWQQMYQPAGPLSARSFFLLPAHIDCLAA
jgi:hypothetical protein